jgi:DNA mismatch repair ATPase MutS
MDKSCQTALQTDLILNLIEPAGDAGRHLMKHLAPCVPGQEALLRKKYKQLEILQTALHKNKKLEEQLRAALSEVPWLPQTIKALQDRTLLLHELFEVKKLVHYARLVQKLCRKHDLDKLYPLPDLENLYAMLDPDQTNSPAFSLSPAFDTRLAKLLVKMQELQQSRRQEEARLLKEAAQAAGLVRPLAEVVLSRQQTAELKKLQKSGYYTLAEENFANLTFRLKDSPELASIKKQTAVLAAKLTAAEEDVLAKLSKKLLNFSKVLTQTSDLLAELDWDFAKALFGLRYGCCQPVISAKLVLTARQAVNLPVKLALEAAGRRYQPLDISFNTTLNVLTGPNMGGKTTALKTAGQLCLLAAFAIPLPAKDAELCLFDQISFNREQDTIDSLSSFGREVVALTTALPQPGRSLFLFDELARGTNPAEGEALLLAVLDYLAKRDCLVLAATHYDRPAHLPGAAQYAIKGIDAKALDKLAKTDKTGLDNQLDLLNSLLDYNPVRLSLKTKPPRNALPVASALGMPQEIIKKAEKLLES